VSDSKTVQRGTEAEIRHRDKVWQEFVAERGRRYANCRFTNWEADAGSSKAAAVDTVRAYVDQHPETVKAGKGLVLLGACGTGKDHLMVAAVFHLIAKLYFGTDGRVCWTSGARIFNQLHDAMKRSTPSSDLLGPMRMASLLVISDPCESGQELTKWEQSTMLELIDSRYNNLRPTWVTINCNGKQQLEQMLGAAIVDRLVDGATIIGCNWPSHRKPGFTA
jgi:DNA replication protein DnaC